MPKVAAWQAVRCYASGSSLDKTEVYERIKQLLSGFDKVRLPSCSFWSLDLDQKTRILGRASSVCGPGNKPRNEPRRQPIENLPVRYGMLR
jgi:hypothetical protein